ncbi:MAG TPA: flagellar export chaperone FliS [Phycisphaerae bacterium]|nr:flagellar export chaperone FliS [Phycisphaerae bacterium]
MGPDLPSHLKAAGALRHSPDQPWQCGGLPRSARAYLETEAATAAPHKLRLMLYDSASRLARRALKALDDGDDRAAADLLLRASRIVLGLVGPLRSAAAPAPCENLARLFGLVRRRLIEAGYYRRREALREAIRLLDFCRPALGALVCEASGPYLGQGSCPRRDWVG